MARTISGVRVARSALTPTNESLTAEFDFQLAGQQGVRILSIQGGMSLNDVTESTNLDVRLAVQTLHRATGTLETVPLAAASDAITIDSEILYRQDMAVMMQEEAATRGGSAAAVMVVPSSSPPLVVPILVASNITHQATADSLIFVLATLELLYEYVEFSLAELGVLFARRE